MKLIKLLLLTLAMTTLTTSCHKDDDEMDKPSATDGYEFKKSVKGVYIGTKATSTLVYIYKKGGETYACRVNYTKKKPKKNTSKTYGKYDVSAWKYYIDYNERTFFNY